VSTLVLKHANKNLLGAIDLGPNDFDVLDTDRCVGRIFMSQQAPQGSKFISINSNEVTDVYIFVVTRFFRSWGEAELAPSDISWMKHSLVGRHSPRR
jgi:hypothetical protein